MQRNQQNFVMLPDGRTIRFSLTKRHGPEDHFLFASYMSKDGRRLERSTKQINPKEAYLTACCIIKESYDYASGVGVTWEKAEKKLKEGMKIQNMRDGSIEDYMWILHSLKNTYPYLVGPNDVTEPLAKLYIGIRSREVNAFTLSSNITKLNSIWKKWFIKELNLLTENPWENITKPKVDKKTARYIRPEEEQAFYDYLYHNFLGWDLPELFYKVLGVTGCRVAQLAQCKSSALRDGRLYLSSETSKGRKDRNPKLPTELYTKLVELNGRDYLWENFNTEINRIFAMKNQARMASRFDAMKFKSWIQEQLRDYCRACELKDRNFKRFSVHNFRSTAMSAAIRAGVSIDHASIAFGCNPGTIVRHYLNQDEEAISDDVMNIMAGLKKDL